MPHKILKCTCKHPYQDSKYGSGNRVFVVCEKDRHINGYKCTVCSAKKAEGEK